MSEWRTVRFEEILSSPLRNGVSYPSKMRGQGIPMVNMREIFAYDIIRDQECELVPLKEHELGNSLLAEGDLLFARQSLTYEGAGRCVLVGASERPRTWESHLIRARINRKLADPRFIYYYFRSAKGRRNIETIINQVAAAGIRGSDLKKLQVPIPPLRRQVEISALLGALDDMIAVNERIVITSRELGLALFAQAVAQEAGMEVSVESVSCVLTRGVAPKYSESPDEMMVLNQKCIRGGRVSLTPARRTLRDKVKAPKLLVRNDVLVNSTGVGTLGRVALWTSDEAATVDSHITIVRFDEAQVDPICAGFAMLRAQPEIEAMGEGSTGQTELRRTQLGELEISLPSKERQRELRPKLDSLEARAGQAVHESRALATLRDTLLPQLMSGRLRVKDAEKIVEDAT
ncbi:restriction endonuclease subunit S [Streptomyces sp. NRRL S-481]|uniref:restriction endonuclease subunit S n=1 Tax=Streptomyces sp. NRRL S-481 TaxID=1463911 RepID=UPI00099C2EA7|nr:restriction endonuclease subunit S [Streptomyces sp. NRRL S-481]